MNSTEIQNKLANLSISVSILLFLIYFITKSLFLLDATIYTLVGFYIFRGMYWGLLKKHLWIEFREGDMLYGSGLLGIKQYKEYKNKYYQNNNGSPNFVLVGREAVISGLVLTILGSMVIGFYLHTRFV